MRIMLVETSEYFPSSPLFYEALLELGRLESHEIEFVDEASFRRPWEDSLVHKFFYRASRRRPVSFWALNSAVVTRAQEFRPDVVLTVKGAFISARTLQKLSRGGAYLVNYATDDPFNRAVNTPVLLNALPNYDLICTTKTATIPDIRSLTRTDVEFIPFGYKPAVHFPEVPPADQTSRFVCDVAFIGGSDRDRVPYFVHLMEALPELVLALYGGGWEGVPSLRAHRRGFAVGEDFRFAVSGAKICVNLVRKANRDGHVMRTFEVPACGGFMLAERTTEHQRFFTEDADVAFFETAPELVTQVKRFFGDESSRRQIARRGHDRVISGDNSYLDRAREILSLVQVRAR